MKSKAQLDAIDEKLKPINELKKKRRSEQDSLRNVYADLEVRPAGTQWEVQSHVYYPSGGTAGSPGISPAVLKCPSHKQRCAMWISSLRCQFQDSLTHTQMNPLGCFGLGGYWPSVFMSALSRAVAA